MLLVMGLVSEQYVLVLLELDKGNYTMAISDATAKALAKAGARLREGARVHRRSANAHRRAARSMMSTFAELDAICRAHGIELDITEIEGDHSNE